MGFVWVLAHNGKLSHFFAGVSTCFSHNIASARAMRRRAESKLEEPRRK
jgi:hypothetical protein